MTQIDRPILDACLADMRNAPRDNAPISHLCYRPDFGQRVFADTLTLDVEKGVTGDRWATHAWLKTQTGAPDPRVQVAVIPTRLLNLVWPGDDDPIYPGDTIAADIDLSEEALPTGTQLQVGSAVIEISDVFNDGCVKWKARYGQEAYKWVRDPYLRPLRPRGIYCQVVQSGVITMGDKLLRL